MAPRSPHPPLIDVAVPYPVDKLFTYRVPEGLRGRVKPGCRVVVPFGKTRVVAYVAAERSRAPGAVRIREIAGLVDAEPLLDERLLALAGRMAAYYLHPLGEILRAMLPARIRGEGRPSAGAKDDDAFPEDAERPLLTPEQLPPFEAVTAALASGRAERFLLHGVTGSGKTEVYLRCIEEALARGKAAIVLIPEIALIPQTTARFRRRFGESVAVLHSRLTGAQRASLWRAAAAGAVRVVVGARSAVFAPVRDLGIIVVDEEQDSSFKQEDKPHYSAVWVAGERARIEGAVLLLGSATPSLETYDAARRGDIRSFELRSRPGGLALPRVEIVDMRGKDGLLSEELLGAIESCVKRGEQAVVLMNRRGHASFVQCRACGWVERCPNCSISLTFHSRGHRLRCHYCGFREGLPDACPRCGELRFLQRGAGTQRLEMELANLVPGIRIARMDLDTTAGKRGHLAVLERFARREADVLLGTQMVAKGHHYPNVTVIGVVSADRGLHFPDFRAAERTFRLLFQAAGRTGRGERGGRVIIQSRAPDHFIYGRLVEHDFHGFAAVETELRRSLRYPPAGRLLLFTVSARAAGSAEAAAAAVAGAVAGSLREAVSRGACEVLGPTPALIERLRSAWRWQILCKGELDDRLKRAAVIAAREAVSAVPGAEVAWDVDPANIA